MAAKLVKGNSKFVRVAAAQYQFDQLETLDDWRLKIAQWVKDAADGGGDLLMFPEYAAIEQASALGTAVFGNLQSTLREVSRLEQERVDFHRELAVEHKVHILVGSGPSLGEDGKYYNQAHLISPSGSSGVQSKLMMTPFEVEWGICAGDRIQVFDTDLGRLGIAICYDIEFPLIARAMACSGVELILVPSCTERISGYHRVRTGAMARALENTIAVVSSPTVGEALWSPAVDMNCGAAGFYVPAEAGVSDTGILMQGEMDKPGWVLGEFDLAALEKTRKTGEMRNFTDWVRQPGESDMSPCHIDVINLRE